MCTTSPPIASNSIPWRRMATPADAGWPLTFAANDVFETLIKVLDRLFILQDISQFANYIPLPIRPQPKNNVIGLENSIPFLHSHFPV